MFFLVRTLFTLFSVFLLTSCSKTTNLKVMGNFVEQGKTIIEQKVRTCSDAQVSHNLCLRTAMEMITENERTVTEKEIDCGSESEIAVFLNSGILLWKQRKSLTEKELHENSYDRLLLVKNGLDLQFCKEKMVQTEYTIYEVKSTRLPLSKLVARQHGTDKFVPISGCTKYPSDPFYTCSNETQNAPTVSGQNLLERNPFHPVIVSIFVVAVIPVIAVFLKLTRGQPTRLCQEIMSICQQRARSREEDIPWIPREDSENIVLDDAIRRIDNCMEAEPLLCYFLEEREGETTLCLLLLQLNQYRIISSEWIAELSLPNKHTLVTCFHRVHVLIKELLVLTENEVKHIRGLISNILQLLTSQKTSAEQEQAGTYRESLVSQSTRLQSSKEKKSWKRLTRERYGCRSYDELIIILRECQRIIGLKKKRSGSKVSVDPYELGNWMEDILLGGSNEQLAFIDD